MFGFGSKKKDQKQKTAKIVSVGFEETSQAPSSTASLLSTQEALSHETVAIERDELRKSLQPSHSAIADKACDNVRDLCTQEEGWTVWEEQKNIKLEKKELEPGRIAGRCSCRWIASDYGLDTIEDFLWDNEAKAQYDEFSAAMLLMVQYEGDYHVVDQVFKSRFGISGRDFVVAVHKRREDDENFERLVIGVASVPAEHEVHVEALLEPETSEKYHKLKSKVVRGHAYAAGYYVQKDKKTNEITLVYVNDADVKSKGVPQWIVTRVKLDQLKIVKNIPGCVEAFIQKKQEEAAAPKEAAEAATGGEAAPAPLIDKATDGNATSDSGAPHQETGDAAAAREE